MTNNKPTRKTFVNNELVAEVEVMDYKPKGIQSQITYEDIRANFRTGEPFTEDYNGRQVILVYSRAMKLDDTEVVVKVAHYADSSIAESGNVLISSSALMRGNYQELNLHDVLTVQELISLSIRGTKQQIVSLHEDSYADNCTDDSINVIGTSDDTGKVTFNVLDAIYALMVKGDGRGRLVSDFKTRRLDMLDSTLAKLLVHADFIGLVKEHETKKRNKAS